MNVTERFLKYVSYDTQSDENSLTSPSTEKQFILADELKNELTQIGVSDACVSEYGIVSGTVPANVDNAPILGFIAHYDTAPVISGANVKPRIIRNYDGLDVVLNKELGIIMKPSEFEMLKSSIGEDLIVTDGTTLLGADDKAGVAAIMTAVENLLSPSAAPHGTIRVAFTPDEEVGRGTVHFDTESFGADFAYTVDGGPVGELEYENFNAASAVVTVRGLGIHPGSAKGKMINSLNVAMEFHSMLPPLETPENTENYEGFIHITDMNGSVEETIIEYILRDHDMDKLLHKKNLMTNAAEYLNQRYDSELISVEIKDNYHNMKEQIIPHFHLIENAKSAMEELGITPVIMPIRGGTDGANLSFMGLPCPNLGTGGYCFHGRYEHITIQSLERNVELLLKIMGKYTKRP